MARKISKMSCGIVVLCLVCLAKVSPRTPAGEAGHTVKTNKGEVKLDEKLNSRRRERVSAGSIKVMAKTVILTKLFLPPDDKWEFEEFRKDQIIGKNPFKLKFVDIIIASDGSGASASPEGKDKIDVTATVPKKGASAGKFPLACEGNIKRAGGGGFIGPLGPGQKPPRLPEFHWAALVGVLKCNLQVHDGLMSRKALSEDEEETRGAFTIANLNDTDSDGKKDSDPKDIDVPGEKDLIRLVINKPEPADLRGTLVLSITGDRKRVRTWESSDKKKEDRRRKFNIGKIKKWPVTMWLEGLQPSKSLDGEEITLRHGRIELDKAKVTFVWVDFVEAKHDRIDKLWKDTGEPTKKLIDLLGGKVGLGAPGGGIVGIRNIIAFKFKALPVGVGTAKTKTDFVKFDSARQIEGKEWQEKGGELREIASFKFPTTDDSVNDDPSDRAETNIPNAKGHLFTVDAPGARLRATADKEIWRENFREFFRVRFDDIKPSGGTPKRPKIDGTRCSPKHEWHLRHTWRRRGRIWVRTTGDDKETPENDVGDKHITVRARMKG